MSKYTFREILESHPPNSLRMEINNPDISRWIRNDKLIPYIEKRYKKYKHIKYFEGPVWMKICITDEEYYKPYNE